ncbi:hypothetical protein T492DRAFT_874878, partial [Pavlovales sp. CCMP2436]
DRVTVAKKELNLLAALITPSAAPDAPFKLNLFPDSLDKPGGGGGGGVASITIDFKDTAGRRKELDALVSGMDLGGDDDEDDLLALMDRAGSNK